MIELPLFPLSSIVLPGGILPLRLFESRYIDMVKNCFKTETGFGVCLIRDGNEVGAPAQPYPQGTEVKIVDFDQGSDGLLHITTSGVEEFDLLDYRTESDGLLIGKIRKRGVQSCRRLQSVHQALASKLVMILRYVEPNINYPEERLDDAAWVCNRLLELLPLDSQAKYEMLKLDDLDLRLDALSGLQFTIESEQ